LHEGRRCGIEPAGFLAHRLSLWHASPAFAGSASYAFGAGTSLLALFCALRFFYGVTLGHSTIPERIAYAREPRKLPVVLGADEVVSFLEAIPSLKSRIALTTVYATGLRVSEVAFLKVADIDSQRMVIRVEQGKGGRDRYVISRRSF
jgi:integrase